MNLDELLSTPVAPTEKGWPAVAGALPLGDVGRQGWNLLREDLPLPVALLKASGLVHNGRWMRSFLEHFDVRLCPHGKTTMAPQLFARQLGDGAWGITVATVQQLMVCRRFGVPRVLLANQLIGRQARAAAPALGRATRRSRWRAQSPRFPSSPWSGSRASRTWSAAIRSPRKRRSRRSSAT
jgi:D-serine dehydratase